MDLAILTRLPKIRTVVLLTSFVVSVQIFDAYHTVAHFGASGEERNPLMLALLRLGPAWFLTVKIAVPLLTMPALAFVIASARIPRDWRLFFWWALCVIAGLYAYVVYRFIVFYFHARLYGDS